MSRVFIIEAPRSHIDMSKAAAFGELIEIWGHREQRSSIFEFESFKVELINKLTNYQYDEENDFFAIVGGLVPNCLAVAVLAKHYPKSCMLVFDARGQQYLKCSL